MKTGITTELEVQYAISKLGATVSIPYGDCARYDHVWDIDGKLLRVQIKTAAALEDLSGFKFPGRNNAGKYDSSQIDGIATIFNGKCYYVPVEDCSNETKLRFTLPEKSDPTTVKFAFDYELERILNL